MFLVGRTTDVAHQRITVEDLFAFYWVPHFLDILAPSRRPLTTDEASGILPGEASLQKRLAGIVFTYILLSENGRHTKYKESQS